MGIVGTYQETAVRGEVVDEGLREIPANLSVIEQQTRGEVDIQIATAKKYPRSIKAFRAKALEYATMDEDTAASCFYSLPRGGKPIEGPSVRLAEIVAAAYGHMRVASRIISEDDRFVVAQAYAWDLENNVAVGFEVRRRITDRRGHKYNDDMIGVTANAAASIALRNAILKVVPMALVRPIYIKAREVAVGDAKTLSARRSEMAAYFSKMGVTEERLFAAIDRAGIEDITLDDLATLKGLATAIRDGDTTVDQAFPEIKKEQKDDAPRSKAEQMAQQVAGSAPEPAKPSAPAAPVSEPAQEPKHTEERVPSNPDATPPLSFDPPPSERRGRKGGAS